MNSVNQSPEIVNVNDIDLLMVAHQWGKEDALERREQRGSIWYLIHSPAWESYNCGYEQGLTTRRLLDGDSPEGEFMLGVLMSMRSGDIKPLTKLTDEQLDAIDAEWVGHEFSTTAGQF